MPSSFKLPVKACDTITSINEPPNPYDKICNGVLATKDEDEAPEYTEDIFQPYNMKAKQFNEWKDRKFEWDVLCAHLNTRTFQNQGFKEN